jgi:hypothetical protein
MTTDTHEEDMSAYTITIPKQSEEEVKYLRGYFDQQETDVQIRDIVGVEVRITPKLNSVLNIDTVSWTLRKFLKKFRPDDVISFVWATITDDRRVSAGGVVVSADGVSHIDLAGQTMKREDQVRKIYSPVHREEYRRFVSMLARHNQSEVIMLKVRDTITFSKAKLASVDPYELHSLTNAIWCGQAGEALEGNGWERLNEPGMAVLAFMQHWEGVSLASSRERFLELLRAYDPSKNNKPSYEDDVWFKNQMEQRMWSRPFMLGPTGIFPGQSIRL